MTLNFVFPRWPELSSFLQAWRDEGLALSTSSNEACKLYDAILTQVPASTAALPRSAMPRCDVTH